MQRSTALLRPGDTGEAVRELQQRLDGSGVPVEPSTVYDDATVAAVRAFQLARGLHEDGICGPETWAALIESAYRLGDRLLYLRHPMLRGDDVADLQRRLNALGFDAGREDGILGPATEQAVRQFQRNAGLATDGVCGPATIAALGRLGSLAAGSVAAVREREMLRQAGRRLEDRRCFIVVDPGIEVLGAGVARLLREAGAVVALDASGSDPSVLAADANRFESDVCLALAPGTAPGARCAYFATERFRSEAGFWIATQCTNALRPVLPAVEEPVGRRYRLLRETRMAAVTIELFSGADPDGIARLLPHVPAVAAAIAAGVRLGVESPIELGC